MSGSTITPSLSDLVREAGQVVSDGREQFGDNRNFDLIEKLASELSRLSSVGVGEEPRAPSASLEVKDLLASAIAMRDDLIQRAKFDMSNAVPVVACGNSVWMKFADAIHSYQASVACGSPISKPVDDGAVERAARAIAYQDLNGRKLTEQERRDLVDKHWPKSIDQAKAALQAAEPHP